MGAKCCREPDEFNSEIMKILDDKIKKHKAM